MAARRYAADNPRVASLIANYDSYKNKEDQRYIHLVDGGISDNLGIRTLTNFIEMVGGAVNAPDILGYKPRYLVAIVVNAETSNATPLGRSNEPPSTTEVVNSITKAQLSRYNLV